MSKPDSWLPLYFGDYLSDTMHLTTEQHGAYLLLLMSAWSRGGSLPNDEGQLAAICRADKSIWKRIRAAVLAFFTVEGDCLVQKRLTLEYQRALKMAEKQKANGAKGGRPKLTQTKPMGYFWDNPNESPTQPQPQEPQPKNTTSTTEPLQPSESPPSSSSDFSEQRAKAFAGQCVAMELERGKRIAVSPADPRILAWVTAGITSAQLREAWKNAAFQRECNQDSSAINVGFLDVFVGKLLAPSEPQSAVTACVRQWHETATGIEAKGRELGIAPPDPLTGGFPAFKDRVFAAAGMSEGAAA